jgi:uncharacterized membrane protein YdbT with pleckstrin-like domain
MSHLRRPYLFSAVVGLLVLIVSPAGLAQEEAPTTTAPAGEEGAVVEVPEPAVELVPETGAEAEQAWTYRYLVPTSLVIALLVVVGSIVAYFLKVVRTRYRLIQ